MIKQLLPLSLLLLASCGKTVYYQDPPELPVLDKKITDPCPPLPLLSDRSIGTIANEDANGAYQYARCQTKHATMVKIYETARLAYQKYKEEIEAIKAKSER